MLMSTLSILEGQKYRVIGIVFSTCSLASVRNANLESAFTSLEKQATSMGADAIIDIKITDPGGERVVVVITGTAVKLIEGEAYTRARPAF